MPSETCTLTGSFITSFGPSGPGARNRRINRALHMTAVTHSPEHLLAVENELSNRPRHVLNDRPLANSSARCQPPRNRLCCDVDLRK